MPMEIARWLAAGKYSIQSMEAGEGDITVSQLVKELLKREWSNEQYRQMNKRFLRNLGIFATAIFVFRKYGELFAI